MGKMLDLVSLVDQMLKVVEELTSRKRPLPKNGEEISLLEKLDSEIYARCRLEDVPTPAARSAWEPGVFFLSGCQLRMLEHSAGFEVSAEPEWKQAMRNLRRLAEIKMMEPRPQQESEYAARVAALMDEEDARILAVASDTKLSANERMKRILVLDRSATGWKSTKWAGVLGVKDAGIRQTETWKELQEKRKHE
jgi:hypothetical protein